MDVKERIDKCVDKYKEYEQIIGIDFTDSKIFNLAMDGFINVLLKIKMRFFHMSS